MRTGIALGGIGLGLAIASTVLGFASGDAWRGYVGCFLCLQALAAIAYNARQG